MPRCGFGRATSLQVSADLGEEKYPIQAIIRRGIGARSGRGCPDKKFDVTAIRYTTVGGKMTISEIRLDGTKTRLLLNP
jgi:hypothetical protein